MWEIMERLIAGTLEGTINFTIHYLLSTSLCGLQECRPSRRIPNDILTHNHNRAKSKYGTTGQESDEMANICCMHNSNKTEHTQISKYHTRITTQHVQDIYKLARSSNITYAFGDMIVWYKLFEACARYVNTDSCGKWGSRMYIICMKFKEWYEERRGGGDVEW